MRKKDVVLIKEKHCVSSGFGLRQVSVHVHHITVKCSGLYDCSLAGLNVQTTGHIDQHMKKTSFRAS